MMATDYLRFVAALLVVVALIAVIAWGLRRFGLAAGSGGSRQGRRLGVVESLAIDNRTRLVLVRRDDAEHLLVLGVNGASVIERQSNRSASGEGGTP